MSPIMPPRGYTRIGYGAHQLQARQRFRERTYYAPGVFALPTLPRVGNAGVRGSIHGIGLGYANLLVKASWGFVQSSVRCTEHRTDVPDT